MKVAIKKLRDDAFIPRYKTPGASGFDLAAVEPAIVPTGGTALVKTGIAVAIPEGFELQVRPRGGVSFGTELSVKNSPGTVDRDYRGEVLVMVKNNSPVNQVVPRGYRIAQGVIAPVVQAEFELVDELDDTVRGEGRLSSTGTHEEA